MINFEAKIANENKELQPQVWFRFLIKKYTCIFFAQNRVKKHSLTVIIAILLE